jgi:phage terminase small subunit
MNHRGRKSQAELNVVVAMPTGKQRLRPPPDLSAEEKAAFSAIVSSIDADHFIPSDLPLLSSYATAIVQERNAISHLKDEGYVVNGKPSPWVVIQEKAHRQMVALTLRLRLSPQGRGRNKVKSERTMNAYDRLELENDDDAD